MRVGVEHVQAPIGAPDEAVDRLAPLVPEPLSRGERIAPRQAPHSLLRQHTIGAQLTDDLRDVDERMSAVVLGELGLIGCLESIVELLGYANAYLTSHASNVKAHFQRRQTADDQAQKCRKQLGVLQVGADRVGHPRILDLDRHFAAVAEPGRVDLADRSRGEWLPVERDKSTLDRAAKLTLKHRARELRRHRRCIIAQPCQTRLVDRLELRWHRGAGRDEREHLPGLHQGALGAAEQLGVALRRADVKLGGIRASQLAPQSSDNCLSGRASRQSRERGGAPHAPTADAIAFGERVSLF
jgi:hypothetical protein